MEEVRTDLHFWDKSHMHNNNLALAKAVFDPETKRTKYFVKAHELILCNPLKYISFEFWKQREQWEYKSVPKQCYDLYVLFLNTHNELYVRDAERVYISQ